MGEEVAHYQEGDRLIIKDVEAAKRTISMQNDFETDEVVRVEHNFGSFLVCDSVDETNVPRVKRFPPATADNSESTVFESEQKKCG